MTNTFPKPILDLPEAKMPFPGCQGYLFQGETQQIVFLKFHEDTELPVHTHADQWEIVLEGSVEFTVNGEKRVYTKGESFYVEGGVPHSASIKAGYLAIGFFNQPDRYKPKASDEA